MLLLLQNVLYCLLYVMLIKCAVKNDGLNCLYFYPKEYIEEAEKRGIANKETVMKKSKWFMIPFCVIIFVALILIISIWNHVTDFKTAYFQSFLFLVIMNWFDGIVIDRLQRLQQENFQELMYLEMIIQHLTEQELEITSM